MSYELIITEKPNASKRIADALADGKPIKENIKKVPYYKVTHGNQDIIVACAVGHLYGLAEKNKKKGWTYPIFEVEWIPTSKIHKDAKFSKKYLDVIKKLAKDADKFTVACDYDVEGEVIGLNIVRFACKQKDAKRMKFSTLTKQELIESYEKAQKHLDWGQAEAGETRHILDYYYGINISRALTTAIKKAGMFKILSAGRVQAPALKIVVDREKEIAAFKPVPFWQIELNGEAKNKAITAWHKEDKFWEKKKADEVMNKVKGEKKAIVDSVERKRYKQQPPVPFDLTTLQTEAYRCFRIKPKFTLDIAQNLYSNGYISYPRTSSQQLPESIGYKNIMQKLARQKNYAALCAKIMKKPLKPNNGKKKDPAHPAIYPTGIPPRALNDRAKKIYDLIVKRFFATFSEHAERETMHIHLDVKKETFLAKGTRTVVQGWHVFYAPYVKLEEEELPAVVKDDIVDVKKITLHSKETQPPKRYTPSSIIKEMEKRGLGTKATRASIIDTLYARNYVIGESLTATELGVETIKILEKYIPEIVDVELTKNFEEDMEKIREGKQKEEKVLAAARGVLTKILGDFKKKEEEVGESLRKTFTETRAGMITVGKCPNCKDGMLIVRKGKFGRFIACDKYPECKTTFSLPSAGRLEMTTKVCEKCGMPIIKIIRKRKGPQEVCINLDCPTKGIPKKIEEKTCPRCQEGKLVLRKSVYGGFLACNRFPKCMYIESLDKGDKEKDGKKDKKAAAKKKQPRRKPQKVRKQKKK